MNDNDEKAPDAVELPIDGVLDLHTFAPADVASLVAGYLDECAVRGILSCAWPELAPDSRRGRIT